MKKTHEFGNSYFYELGLNKKFCASIPRFKQQNDISQKFDPQLVELFTEWHQYGCTEEAYEVTVVDYFIALIRKFLIDKNSPEFYVRIK